MTVLAVARRQQWGAAVDAGAMAGTGSSASSAYGLLSGGTSAVALAGVAGASSAGTAAMEVAGQAALAGVAGASSAASGALATTGVAALAGVAGASSFGAATLDTAGAASAYEAEVLGDSPSHYWRFGESSGTTAVDEVGAADGVLVNGPVTTPSPPGAGFAFDGADDHVNFPPLTAPGAGSFTVEAWARWTSFTNGRGVVADGNLVAGGDGWFMIAETSANGWLTWRVDDGGTAYTVFTAAGMNDNEWRHLVGVIDRGADLLRLYVDGVEVGTTDISAMGSIDPPAGYEYAGALAVNGSLTNRYLPGAISDVATYPTALTPAQIAAHYEAGAGVKALEGAAGASSSAAATLDTAAASAYEAEILADSPVRYWRLGESSGTTAVDEMAGFDLTYVNSPALAVSGLVVGADTAVGFDGTDDHVYGADSAMDALSSFTMEAWIKPDTVGGAGRYALSFSNGTNDDLAAVYVESTGYISGWYKDGTQGNKVIQGSLAVAGDTYHVALVRSGTTMTLYVNGGSVGSIALGATTCPVNRFTIGGLGRAAVTNFWDGAIDEVALYDSALSAAQILSHYEVGSGAKALEGVAGSSSSAAAGSLDFAEGPAAVPDLAAWYEAADLVAVGDGGTFTEWPSRDGYGPTLVAASATPTWREVGGLGMPVVEMGADNLTADFASALGAEVTALIAVYVPSNPSSGEDYFLWMGTGPSYVIVYATAASDVVMLRNTSSQQRAVQSTLEAAPRGKVVGARRVGSTIEQWVDGSGKSGSLSGTAVFDDLRLGSSAAGTQIAAALVFDRALSVAEIADMTDYLDQRLRAVVLESAAGSSSSAAATLVTASAYEAEVLADSPSHYWRLGETSGTTAVDEVGSVDGTYVNAPTLAAAGAINGDSDTAVTFDGTDDYLHMDGAAALLTAGNSWTVEWWMKTTTSAATVTPFSAARSSTTADYVLMHLNYGGDTNLLRYAINSGGSGTEASFNTGGVHRDGAWHHYAMTYDGTTLTAYLDGASIGTVARAMPATLDQVTFGALRRSDLVLFTAATIDEAAIYPTALSAAQILAHYAVGAGSYAERVDALSPTHYWRLGEYTGTFADSGSASNDGTAWGSPARSVGPLQPGDANRALAFDGVDDRVALASDVTVTGTGTIMCLIKPQRFADDQMILGKSNSDATYLSTPNATTIRLQGTSPTGLKDFTVPTMVAGETYHLAIVRSGGNVRCYLNGVESSTGALAWSSTFTVNQIGRYWSGFYELWFKGIIDEVAIWTSTALTAAQVAYIADAAVFPAAADYKAEVEQDAPFAYWRLGESSGTSAIDETGRINGTYVNTPTLGVAGALSGDADTAVEFNGTDESITIGALGFSPVAWELWFYNDVVIDRSTAAQVPLWFGNSGGYMYVSFGDTTGTFSDEIVTIIEDNSPLAGAAWTHATDSIPVGWHHMVVQWNESGWELWIDGVKKTLSISGTQKAPTGNDVVVARHNVSGGFFDGKIDEIAAYMTVLPEARIQAHYDTGTGA